MSECQAARVDDEIAHTASKGWMIAGLVGGAILGAAAVVVTGGTALVAVSAVAAGACWVSSSAVCHGLHAILPVR